VEVDRYEVDLLDLDAGAPLRAHKLQLKYAGAPDALRRVRRAMAWDASRKGRVAEIAARPQERYGCSDRRLGELVDARTPVRVTLVEGEVLQGEIVRVCRYEFVLATKQGEVTIFRHALADLR
jgi:sRNA-binding regulator protein Hfq